jgi:hypothetical protein
VNPIYIALQRRELSIWGITPPQWIWFNQIEIRG